MLTDMNIYSFIILAGYALLVKRQAIISKLLVSSKEEKSQAVYDIPKQNTEQTFMLS